MLKRKRLERTRSFGPLQLNTNRLFRVQILAISDYKVLYTAISVTGGGWHQINSSCVSYVT